MEVKKRKYNMNIPQDMRLPGGIYQTNKKLFVTVHPKMHVDWNFLINYGYYFLTNHSQMLYFFQ